MLSLDDAVVELADHYGGPREPSLLDRLADPLLRTAQPRDGDPVRSTPGSRPPADLSPVWWLLRIQREAIELDMQVRGSTLRRSWRGCILDLPVVTPDDQIRDVHSIVGTWHSTCLTVLGLQAPSRDVRGVACLSCGQKMLRWRPAEDLAVSSTDASALGRIRCNNPACKHPATGRPAVYEGLSLYVLTRRKSTMDG